MPDAITEQAYAEILPRVERMGAAIASAHQALVRSCIEQEADPIPLTQRAFELTDVMTKAAEIALAVRIAELRAYAAGPAAVYAEPLIRDWLLSRSRDRDWTSIAIMCPHGNEQVAIGSTNSDENEVAAILLACAVKLLGERTAGVLEGILQLRSDRSVDRSDAGGVLMDGGDVCPRGTLIVMGQKQLALEKMAEAIRGMREALARLDFKDMGCCWRIAEESLRSHDECEKILTESPYMKDPPVGFQP